MASAVQLGLRAAEQEEAEAEARRPKWVLPVQRFRLTAGFGDVSGDSPGTPAVLEVRAHDVPFALEHGQRLCKLTFEHMLERPEQLEELRKMGCMYGQGFYFAKGVEAAQLDVMLGEPSPAVAPAQSA